MTLKESRVMNGLQLPNNHTHEWQPTAVTEKLINQPECWVRSFDECITSLTASTYYISSAILWRNWMDQMCVHVSCTYFSFFPSAGLRSHPPHSFLSLSLHPPLLLSASSSSSLLFFQFFPVLVWLEDSIKQNIWPSSHRKNPDCAPYLYSHHNQSAGQGSTLDHWGLYVCVTFAGI